MTGGGKGEIDSCKENAYLKSACFPQSLYVYFYLYIDSRYGLFY